MILNIRLLIAICSIILTLQPLTAMQTPAPTQSGCAAPEYGFEWFKIIAIECGLPESSKLQDIVANRKAGDYCPYAALLYDETRSTEDKLYPYNTTALMFACRNRSPIPVAMLLEYPYKDMNKLINEVNDKGETALSIAINELIRVFESGYSKTDINKDYVSKVTMLLNHPSIDPKGMRDLLINKTLQKKMGAGGVANTNPVLFFREVFFEIFMTITNKDTSDLGTTAVALRISTHNNPKEKHNNTQTHNSYCNCCCTVS